MVAHAAANEPTSVWRFNEWDSCLNLLLGAIKRLVVIGDKLLLARHAIRLSVSNNILVYPCTRDNPERLCRNGNASAPK